MPAGHCHMQDGRWQPLACLGAARWLPTAAPSFHAPIWQSVQVRPSAPYVFPQLLYIIVSRFLSL